MSRSTAVSAFVVLFGFGASCTEGNPAPSADGDGTASTAAALPACDPDNGGITLPEGFCALVVADNVIGEAGRARHLAVAPNGDLYVAVQGKQGAETPSERGGIVALRDTTGDGRMDMRVQFGPEGGTGLAIQDGYLYFAPNDAVLRYQLAPGQLEPTAGPDTLVQGLPDEHSHTAKSIALRDGALFVNIGSPTNACQPIGQDRQAGVEGVDPCPQLDTHAGVWRFSASEMGQTPAEGMRWATGIRNAVALSVNPQTEQLYAVQHGRDQLDQWPGYTAEDNAEKPAEELLLLEEGSDFGWPYCYYDPAQNRKVLAPEYGGNGEEVGRCADKAMPLETFPAHWAPNDVLFYTAGQFPERYRGGVFIAWHGSWNRAPLPQEGYKITFQPMNGDRPAGDWTEFASGFAGEETIQGPGAARYRPVGLATGPDGTLFISDSATGRIWRVMYVGDRGQATGDRE